MNSDMVDLVYLDPPFNSNKNYEAPIGSQAAGAAFKDSWHLSDVDLAWHGEVAEINQALYDVIAASRTAHGTGMMSYLVMMSVRLIELERVLKPTGSIYLHCDPTASHYLKMVMDSIFGKDAFRNEVVWGYEKPRPAKRVWKRNHDTLFFYTKGADWTFNPQRVPTLDGKFEMRKPVKRPDGSVWYPKEPGKLAGSWWYDIPSFATRMTAKERTGYPTQKPLKLLERIIMASSNEGDLVLDPFCGCATTMVAAEKLSRQWIGIDISPQAKVLIENRMAEELGFRSLDIDYLTEPPKRTDLPLVYLPEGMSEKRWLYGNQEGRCAGCREHMPLKNLTTDHIVPDSKGGHSHLDNYQLLCNWCNSSKGNRTQEEFLASLRERGIRR